jgi:hypothetical protein
VQFIGQGLVLGDEEGGPFSVPALEGSLDLNPCISRKACLGQEEVGSHAQIYGELQL